MRKLKKEIFMVFIILLSLSVYGQKGNWTVGISTSPLIQLHKSGTSFFDFEFDKWKLYYRGAMFELNSNYYFNDKMSVFFNLGTGYEFFKFEKHYFEFIGNPDELINIPVYSERIFVNSSLGITYDYMQFNNNCNFFITGKTITYGSIFNKVKYSDDFEINNKKYMFNGILLSFGTGIKFNVSKSLLAGFMPNIIFPLPVRLSNKGNNNEYYKYTYFYKTRFQIELSLIYKLNIK
ncbi:MAG: hypothetical protein R6V32_05335 [Bacteroidales bacterium]